MRLTALIEREDDGYVALCPEVDVASQGNRVEQARDNLLEALEFFCLNVHLLKRPGQFLLFT